MSKMSIGDDMVELMDRYLDSYIMHLYVFD